MARTNAVRSFATSIAPNLAPTTKAITADTSLATLKVGDLADIIAAAMVKAQAAPATAPAAKRGRKPSAASVPAPVTAPVVAPVAAAPSAPIDFVFKAKENECYRAANAAVKAAGLQYDAKTNPTGGKYGLNRDAYLTTFWAAFNAKALEVGIPQRSKKAE